mmetsp:Transcript_6675/g.9436  ORF Transcript_6675/g.9436 Transcript_6675/m.9436 type:complete len:365 (+) Transcript_6675:56-1150(+)
MSLALSQPLLARGSSVDWNEYLSSEKESSSTLDLILAGNRLAGKRYVPTLRLKQMLDGSAFTLMSDENSLPYMLDKVGDGNSGFQMFGRESSSPQHSFIEGSPILSDGFSLHASKEYEEAPQTLSDEDSSVSTASELDEWKQVEGSDSEIEDNGSCHRKISKAQILPKHGQDIKIRKDFEGLEGPLPNIVPRLRKRNRADNNASLLKKRNICKVLPVKKQNAACSNCRISKVKCDRARPCGRCVREGRPESCCESSNYKKMMAIKNVKKVSVRDAADVFAQELVHDYLSFKNLSEADFIKKIQRGETDNPHVHRLEKWTTQPIKRGKSTFKALTDEHSRYKGIKCYRNEGCLRPFKHSGHCKFV